MTVELLQYANRAKVAEALTTQGYEVTRMTVNRWARGAEMPKIAERMILALFGHDPDTTKSPPQSFDWDGLVATVNRIEATVLALSAEERLLRPELEAAGTSSTPGGDAPPTEEARPAPARYESGQPPGQ